MVHGTRTRNFVEPFAALVCCEGDCEATNAPDIGGHVLIEGGQPVIARAGIKESCGSINSARDDVRGLRREWKRECILPEAVVSHD